MVQMKDSGIEWNERIPSVWKIGRVKYIFYLSKAKANETNPTILRLAREGIQIRDISTNVGQLAESYSDYNPVEPNDLLLNTMDLISGANCSISKISGVISPAYANLRPTSNDICSKYYDYYFKLQYWSMAFFAHGKGISYDNRWTLNSESLLNYPIVIPPTEEQIAISNFLDNKSTEIKSLIDNLNKQIELLKDYKKEIISETVTKGLDPNVSLKDSGIEWIGKIPYDWKIEKIKFHSKTRNEKEKNEQSTYNYIALENIESFTGNYIETDNKYDKEGTQLAYSGDVLFGKLRPYLAKVFLCECNLNASNEFVVFNPTKLASRYLKYYLLNKNLIDYVNSTTNGTKMPRTSSDVLKNLPIPIMAVTEQELIGKHLDLLCSRVDELISISQEIIDKLNEYSKSLIYEYVTGKKEVI